MYHKWLENTNTLYLHVRRLSMYLQTEMINVGAVVRSLNALNLAKIRMHHGQKLFQNDNKDLRCILTFSTLADVPYSL